MKKTTKKTARKSAAVTRNANRLVTGLQLRLRADAIERDVAREVAELRRLADLLDGVVGRAMFSVGRAKKKIAKKAKRRTAKKVARKTAKKRAAKTARPRGR